ncbi:hypothetical protein [Cupriavidus nantongensis]|uniref:hypothetical protein n=1 Tax=Cupriavidus nantongensis TaxID=1796606 RepID=UPI002245EACC|nr:hypothetical protein [Cupriavidus nantongensis]
MSFREVIEQALHGRSVRKAAIEMGMYQQKLERFYNGKCLPNYMDALVIAREADVPLEEVFLALASEEAARKGVELEGVQKRPSPPKQEAVGIDHRQATTA